ncbi:MAG: ABC transporter permease subunit [Candidatus Thorarchaeota archaeon]
MSRVLTVIIEHLFERKRLMLGFGLLFGIFGYVMTLIIEALDLTDLLDLVTMFPQLEGLLDIFGDWTSPYGILNAEVFVFYWIFVGFFFVYVASSAALPGEVEDKTIDLTLSKPISRSSYLAGKIIFLFILIIGVQAFIFTLIGVGMATSQPFIDVGLYWDRLLAVYIVNIIHSGTLVMTALLFATITLSSKRTMGAALGMMFVMFFIGTFWGFFPEDLQVIKYVSTWFYLSTQELFVQGIFDNFLRDIYVLSYVNVVLIIASLVVFLRRDIPV